jgi:hypothetical protein
MKYREEAVKNEHRSRLAADLSALTSDILTGSVTTEITVARLRSHALWLEEVEKGFQLDGRPEPKKTKGRPGPSDAEVSELFDYWREKTGRTGMKLSPQRSAKLKARLKEQGMPALKAMIAWAVTDDFYSGHTEIETLFKSRDKTENYVHKSGWTPPPPTRAKQGDAIKQLEQRANRAMTEGRLEEATKLKQKIRGLRNGS